MNGVHYGGFVAKLLGNPKQMILEKAKELLITDGYEALNMRTIAKKCNIAIGSIYNYFPNKSELLLEMMTDYWDDFFVYLDKEVINSPLIDALNAMFHKLDDFVKVFKAIWLRPDLYKTPQYVNNGIKREHEYLYKIQQFIELKIEKENKLSDISISELSTFIISNFMSMLQNKRFSYEIFKKIIKKLLL